MKTLYIDSADNKEVTVGLFINGRKYIVRKKLIRQKAQIVLPLIEKLLKKRSIRLQDLDSIEVNPGPGSFTGVRVGVSVANALSYTLGIPVNRKLFKKDKTLVEPLYSA